MRVSSKSSWTYGRFLRGHGSLSPQGLIEAWLVGPILVLTLSMILSRRKLYQEKNVWTVE